MLTWREFSQLSWRITVRRRDEEMLFAQLTAMIHNVNCTDKRDMKTVDHFMPSLHNKRLKNAKPIDWEYEAKVMREWFTALAGVRNG